MKNIFKIIFLLFSIFLLSFTCKNYQDKSKNKAQREYLLNIKVVETFIKKKRKDVEDPLDEAVIFLQGLTGIESDFIPGWEPFVIPSSQNLKDWKDWYKKNKEKLYWDNKEKAVKVRNLNKVIIYGRSISNDGSK